MLIEYLLLIDDGRCVIDVVPGHKTIISEQSSFEEIRVAATRVMETCVDPPQKVSRGGYVGSVGMIFSPLPV